MRQVMNEATKFLTFVFEAPYCTILLDIAPYCAILIIHTVGGGGIFFSSYGFLSSEYPTHSPGLKPKIVSNVSANLPKFIN
jgi:hypothetical protein